MTAVKGRRLGAFGRKNNRVILHAIFDWMIRHLDNGIQHVGEAHVGQARVNFNHHGVQIHRFRTAATGGSHRQTRSRINRRSAGNAATGESPGTNRRER